MPAILWDGQRHQLFPQETVLDGLLRHGVAIPNSCRAGVCQSCLLRASSGPVPPAAQVGLKPTLIEQGCFLACVCTPVEDLEVEAPGTGLRIAARLVETSRLSDTVLRVLLESAQPLDHRAGQYLTLFRPDGLGRSYSIASLPSGKTTQQSLELHVRLIPNGQMSTWLATIAQPGALLTIQGPAGNCFYTAGAIDQPLLLIGTGTGLAPLYGILRDALNQGHKGPIRLYHGALNEAGLYLVPELEALANQHAQFEYRPTLLHTHGPLPDCVLKDHPKLNGWRGFVCGDPQIVTQLKKRLFLAGMASREIHSDAFVTAAPAR